MSIDSVARQLAQQAVESATQALVLGQNFQATGVSLSFQASVNIPAGALVNLFPVGAITQMRLADASIGLPAHGFAPSAIAAGTSGTFLRSGVDAAAGFTEFVSDLWLSDAAPGTATPTPPATAGHLSQRIGMATVDAGMIVDIGIATLL